MHDTLSEVRGKFSRERGRARAFFTRTAFLFPLIERRLLSDYRKGLDFINLPLEFSVLDIATGTGLLAGLFSERGHVDVSGIDFCAPMVKRASARHPSVSFRLFDLVDLDTVESASFDVVSMAFFLHGASRDFRRFVLCHSARICREAVVVIDYFRRGNLFVELIEWIEGPHYREFVKRSGKREFMAAGLSIEKKKALSGLSGIWLCRPDREGPLKQPVKPQGTGRDFLAGGKTDEQG
jgi:SAM-dependent methyltransferase